jgi:hypothetical protein
MVRVSSKHGSEKKFIQKFGKYARRERRLIKQESRCLYNVTLGGGGGRGGEPFLV